MNCEKVYLVYKEMVADNEPPSVVCYAKTPWEARKTCSALAKECVPDGHELGEPLWYGAKPKQEGHCLVFTYPGPNSNSVDLFQVLKTNPWFGQPQLYFGKHVARFTVKELPRSKQGYIEPKTVPECPLIDDKYEKRKPYKKESDNETKKVFDEKRKQLAGLFGVRS